MTKHLIGLLAIALVGLFATTGCDPDAVRPNEMMPLYMEVDAASSYDMLAEDVVISDATLENEPQLMEGREDRHVGPNDRDRQGRPHFHPFGRLLNALNLTEEQRPQVKELMDAHAACVKEAMAAYREYMHGVKERVRAARAEILAQLEAGDITREEARDAIRALNARMREALKSDETRARVREVLKGCDATFYRGLYNILDDDQKALLERWLASRPD